jgi:hypothetical protein
LDILHQFGNPAKFAIRISPCPGYYPYFVSDRMALCHFVINNIIIGDPEEECHLPDWYEYLVNARNFIEANQRRLYRKEFSRLSDREIYELVIKTNQRESFYNKHFLYLPKLDYGVWQKHLLRMDDTLDACIICFYIKNDMIHFIADKWWDKRRGRKRKNDLIFKAVPLHTFLKTLNDTIHFLEVFYPYLLEPKPEEPERDQFYGLV